MPGWLGWLARTDTALKLAPPFHLSEPPVRSDRDRPVAGSPRPTTTRPGCRPTTRPGPGMPPHHDARTFRLPALPALPTTLPNVSCFETLQRQRRAGERALGCSLLCSLPVTAVRQSALPPQAGGFSSLPLDNCRAAPHRVPPTAEHAPPPLSANLASHDPPSFSCGPTVDGTDNVIFLKALPFRLYFRSGQIDPPPSGAKMMALHRASR